MKKTLVSGIKPTGKLHFGNYFGAMKQNIELSNGSIYRSFIFLADYHALNSVYDRELMKECVYDITASYIACGLDVNNAILFRQSDVRAHAELSLIFENVVTMPYMMRAHAFKDKEAKNSEIIVGLFTYPILMSADILIYHADIVPVGSDQKQHIEYARDIAGYFNRAYKSEYFKEPEELIIKSLATIPGIDGAKMSKSYNNHIELFCSDEDLKKRVMSIKTDSKAPDEPKDPESCLVYQIHEPFLNEEERIKIKDKYRRGGLGYKEAKEMLLESIIEWRKGKKEIYDELMKDRSKLDEILRVGSREANAVANKTMSEVRVLLGFNP